MGYQIDSSDSPMPSKLYCVFKHGYWDYMFLVKFGSHSPKNSALSSTLRTTLPARFNSLLYGTNQRHWNDTGNLSTSSHLCTGKLGTRADIHLSHLPSCLGGSEISFFSLKLTLLWMQLIPPHFCRALCPQLVSFWTTSPSLSEASSSVNASMSPACPPLPLDGVLRAEASSSSPILSLTHFSQPPAATTLQRLLLPWSPVPSHKPPRALRPRAPLPRPSPQKWKSTATRPVAETKHLHLSVSCSNLLELLVISTFTGTLTAFLSVTSDLYRCHCLTSLPPNRLQSVLPKAARRAS